MTKSLKKKKAESKPVIALIYLFLSLFLFSLFLFNSSSYLLPNQNNVTLFGDLYYTLDLLLGYFYFLLIFYFFSMSYNHLFPSKRRIGVEKVRVFLFFCLTISVLLFYLLNSIYYHDHAMDLDHYLLVELNLGALFTYLFISLPLESYFNYFYWGSLCIAIISGTIVSVRYIFTAKRIIKEFKLNKEKRKKIAKEQKLIKEKISIKEELDRRMEKKKKKLKKM